ncbi:response regulator [Halorientalis salina]|uniref:response regulator n=1 Tax=Halorientalis salina TaxID=2932266 RepID=UPI0010ABEC5B|nr:response regulator [Halorientalis salina]
MREETAGKSIPRVVAVEDNPGDVRLIEEGISAAGIDLELDVIQNGSQAIERFTTAGSEDASSRPDLLLLDLNLPGASGFDVLEVVRTESSFQNVPIVVVSSSENPDDIERIYESAANAYVTKPADPDEYIQMIVAAVDFWIANVNVSPTND